MAGGVAGFAAVVGFFLWITVGGRRNRLERGLKMDDLALLRGGGLLELVAEGAAAVVETSEGLVERGHLVGGSGEVGGCVDTEGYVVEGFNVAIDGEGFGGGGRCGVGCGQQGGQGGLHVALDGADVGLGFVADGVGGFPAIYSEGDERGAEDVQGGLQGCGGGSARSRW